MTKSLFFFTGGSGKAMEGEKRRQKSARDLLSEPAYPDLYEKLKIEQTEKKGMRDPRSLSSLRRGE